MISVDAPPEEWAGQVAALMLELGRDEAQLQLFFETVYAP